jgi:membrane-associated protease RseP (regulator of RpoE activity)
VHAGGGLFVTSLNLLPIGQLDGGHIAYGLFGRKSRVIFLIAIVVVTLILTLRSRKAQKGGAPA